MRNITTDEIKNTMPHTADEAATGIVFGESPLSSFFGMINTVATDNIVDRIIVPVNIAVIGVLSR